MPTTSSLLPREHGVYAELIFPLVTGLAVAAPSLPALALASAAVALFLAHEPVAVLLGARGGRLKEQLERRAKKRGLLLIGAGVLLGGAGVLGAGATIWPALLFPALAGALLIPLVISGRHKSVAGELLVVTTFSTLCLPLAAASGTDPTRIVPGVLVWWLSFALGTLEVHAIKARHKATERSGWTRWGSPLATSLTLVAVVGVLWVGGTEIPNASTAAGPTLRPGEVQLPARFAPAAWALLVPAAVLLTLSVIRVHPRHLKRVGWTLVVANSLALIILLAG
jgi:hypothetical protein